MLLNNDFMVHEPWLVKAYQSLTQPLDLHRAHHALLIHYIRGSGEEQLIKIIAMRLLCQNPQHNKPCQHCHGCQLFIANNHPDYTIVEPEKNKLSIGVDQIRQISSKVYERAQQGGNKVIWINVASLMTEAAANALLKTLEEPPENTYFILSDYHNGQLLPTIRSRCQYYFLTVPELADSIDWLKQHITDNTYNDNEIATALLLNENAPFAALSLLDTTQWQKRNQFYQTLLQSLSEKDYWTLRDSLINQDNLLIRLNWICILWSDALKARQKSGRFIVNRDQVPLVRLIAGLGDDKIIQLYTLWNDTREQLVAITGLNQDLIISNLLAQSEIIVNS